MRDPSHKCDVESSIGTITSVISAQTVDVDGMPRHVCDLRPAAARISSEPEPTSGGGTVADDEPLVIQIPALRTSVEDDEETSDCAQTNDDYGVAESEQETSEPQQNTDKYDDIEERHLEDADPEPLGRSRRVMRQRVRCDI